MRSRTMSGSGLFLIELMLAILIFALASAICLQVFVTASQLSDESVAINRAVISAQSGAECFKATGGDLNETAALLSEVYSGVTTETLDDGSGTITLVRDYIVEITRGAPANGLIEGEVNVRDLSGSLIFSIPVAVLEVP